MRTRRIIARALYRLARDADNLQFVPTNSRALPNEPIPIESGHADEICDDQKILLWNGSNIKHGNYRNLFPNFGLVRPYQVRGPL